MPLVKKAEIPVPLGFAWACEPYRQMRVWCVVGGHERGTTDKKGPRNDERQELIPEKKYYPVKY